MNLLRTLQAPPSWRRLAFISDLHLGPDTPATQAAFGAWLSRVQTDAVFILGDLFEAWVGDDAAALPYAQQLQGQLTAFARPVYFQHGNRDFLLRRYAGMQLLDETCAVQAFGQTVLLAHGDALCLDDVPYQQLRAQVRSPQWQAGFLAKSLDERLRLAAQMRDASRHAQGAQREQGLPFADPEHAACVRVLQANGSVLLVHGHTHRPGQHDLGDGCARWVLSDWDFEQQPPRGDCLIWSAEGWRREPVGA